MIYQNLAVTIPTVLGVLLAQGPVPGQDMNIFDKYGIPLGMVVIMMGALAYLEKARSTKDKTLAKERQEREQKLDERQLKREQAESERRELELEQRKLEREMYERQLDKKSQELQATTDWLRERYAEILEEILDGDGQDNGPRI